MVQSSTKYFADRKQYNENPLSRFNGRIEQFYIVDSYVVSTETQGGSTAAFP
jgi:hypothetical protein